MSAVLAPVCAATKAYPGKARFPEVSVKTASDCSDANLGFFMGAISRSAQDSLDVVVEEEDQYDSAS